MERVKNWPRWAKVLGVTTLAAAVLAVVAKVVQVVRGAEFRLSPEEIREAMESREGFQEAWQKLMDRRR